MLACLGGELPNEFLKSMGIAIRKHHGDKAMANPALSREAAPSAAGGLATRRCFFLIGALVVGGLTAVGIKYYLLPRGLRYKSPDHAVLKPSGLWGHGVGILATLFMLLNFVYPLRKRLPWFKGKGSIAPWLRFHVFVGIMSPLVILFHTAFQWGNQLATTTYVSVRGRGRDRAHRPLHLRLGAHRSARRRGGEAPRQAAGAVAAGAAAVADHARDARSAAAARAGARRRRPDVAPLAAGRCSSACRPRRCWSGAVCGTRAAVPGARGLPQLPRPGAGAAAPARQDRAPSPLQAPDVGLALAARRARHRAARR